ncbi:MAG: phenylacetic acid degradation bifunctional protein PaaZ [Proteobacteria bacterium]|nr:MAG: phenylacetic acid degradation bifunctional protein PaaZ [Pseudomonadota bacterium]
MRLYSYAQGEWFAGKGKAQDLFHAVSGEKVAEISSEGLNFSAMLEYGRKVGGPKLRAMTFHQRAAILKQLAKYLMERKDNFYKVSEATGATKGDSWIDIEGGIGTLFVFSSKGRRELPNDTVYGEGDVEQISKLGTFLGRHICVPLEGAALHINAFNFPCWGMLEKFAPTFLAGMPAIIKPASATAYLAESMVKAMIESGLLPEGSLQLICGGVGDIFEHLTCQDVVTFTGSAHTGRKLKEHKSIVENSIRFNLEADSLNCSILGKDARPGSDEFNLFVKEVAREMTVKAGQKCTAIRRTIVPDDMVTEVIEALKQRLSGIKLGNPAVEGVGMGPLATRDQVKEVTGKLKDLKKAGELVFGHPDNFDVLGAEKSKGAFCPSMLLFCSEPFKHTEPHDVEAFGPINTVMPYKSVDEAVELARLGRGSLVGSLFTYDSGIARQIVLGTAPFHGRIFVMNRESAKESTGHGSPLPHLVHGGPGRAGGGEEMGGIRGVLHYMQRTALQGSPDILGAVCHDWVKGGKQKQDRIHPFRKYFEELEIGETLITHRRTITETDIVNFAALSGDHFYAHTDEIAAKDSIFGKRVAHGYLLLGLAAGLFVDPAPGPVLANYGLEKLRFVKPVYAGDTVHVRLTCKQKTAKDTPPDGVPQGVVAWDVEVFNQNNESVAVYIILTLVKRRG